MALPRFRIANPCEDNYMSMIESLCQHKDNGGIFYFFENESLPSPMKNITSVMKGGEKFYKNFCEISYNEPDDQSFFEINSLMHDNLSRKYDVHENESELVVMDDDINYGISSSDDHPGLTGIYSRGILKKPEMESLSIDIPVFFDITSTVVNSFYDFLGKELNVLLVPKYTGQRVFVVKQEKGSGKSEAKEWKVTFDDIGGCEEAKNELRRISYCIDNPESSWKWGVGNPRGIILYGPPGTGKTLLAKATANEINASFYPVRISDITSMWYGQSEENMAEIFENARDTNPSIIFFDEIDALGMKRDGSHEATGRIVATMLSEMDGMDDCSGVLVMGATNRLPAIDPALLRSGRFEKKIEVPLPDSDSLADIYRIKLRGRNVAGKMQYKAIAEKSDGMSGADVDYVIRRAAEMKIDEEMRGRKPGKISTKDILRSIDIFRKEVERTGCMASQDHHISYQ